MTGQGDMPMYRLRQAPVPVLAASLAILLAGPVSAATPSTERVSVSSAGEQGDEDSQRPSVSADGRFVAFESPATDLVAGDTNGMDDVFVHDRKLLTTERVSVSSAGEQGNGYSSAPSISADGRFVAFASYATDLVAGDTNGAYDVFVRDRQAGTTERVSVSSGGEQGNLNSSSPDLGRRPIRRLQVPRHQSRGG
jgi:Tol biopolymer transport system component